MSTETPRGDTLRATPADSSDRRRLTSEERAALRRALNRVKVRKAMAEGIEPQFLDLAKRRKGKVIQIRDNNDL